MIMWDACNDGVKQAKAPCAFFRHVQTTLSAFFQRIHRGFVKYTTSCTIGSRNGVNVTVRPTTVHWSTALLLSD